MFGSGRFTFKDQKVAGETEDWIVEQADAADVTAGLAVVAGDLIIRHKTNGTKHEHEAG